MVGPPVAPDGAAFRARTVRHRLPQAETVQRCAKTAAHAGFLLGGGSLSRPTTDRATPAAGAGPHSQPWRIKAESACRSSADKPRKRHQRAKRRQHPRDPQRRFRQAIRQLGLQQQVQTPCGRDPAWPSDWPTASTFEGAMPRSSQLLTHHRSSAAQRLSSSAGRDGKRAKASSMEYANSGTCWLTGHHPLAHIAIEGVVGHAPPADRAGDHHLEIGRARQCQLLASRLRATMQPSLMSTTAAGPAALDQTAARTRHRSCCNQSRPALLWALGGWITWVAHRSEPRCNRPSPTADNRDGPPVNAAAAMASTAERRRRHRHHHPARLGLRAIHQRQVAVVVPSASIESPLTCNTNVLRGRQSAGD